MSPLEWYGVVVTGSTVIVVPLVAMLIRGSIKWTRLENKLDGVIDDVRELVISKDKVHLLIMEDMRTDREATNKRLRWLEEYLWTRSNRNAVRNPPSG